MIRPGYTSYLALLFIYELQSLLPRYHINGAGFLSEAYTITFLGDVQHLRSESGANKLPIG